MRSEQTWSLPAILCLLLCFIFLGTTAPAVASGRQDTTDARSSPAAQSSPAAGGEFEILTNAQPDLGTVAGKTWILLAGPLESKANPAPFSARLQGLSVAEALRYLFAGTDVHLVAGDSLSEQTWGQLDSTSVPEAFERILTQHDLTWRADGGAILVDRRESRTLRLNYVQETESPFWEELEVALQGFLSPEGELVLHRRSGILSVTDRPGSLRRLEGFLAALKEDMSRQINLEASIIEVMLDEEMEVGVDWSAAAYGWDGVEGNTSSGQLLDLSTVTGAGVFQMGLVRTDRMEILLDFLEAQGDVRVVSRPRVAAMGNEKAVFRATENIPYYILDVFTSTGSDPYTQYSIEFEEAGVVMEVLAHVGPDGSIMLRVHPTVSSLTGYTASLPNLPPQPIIDLRETETTVRLREGETLVIGGLIQERERTEYTGIPLLSRIPLLGALFRNTSTRESRQELVVSLTPRVVDDAFLSAIRDGQKAVLAPVDWNQSGTAAELAAWEHNRALDAFLAGDPESALRRAERAVALAPKAYAPRLNLALFRAANGDLAGAGRELGAIYSDPAARVRVAVNEDALALLQGKAGRESFLADDLDNLEPEERTVAALNRSVRLLRAGRREEAGRMLEEVRNGLEKEDLRRLILWGPAELDR